MYTRQCSLAVNVKHPNIHIPIVKKSLIKYLTFQLAIYLPKIIKCLEEIETNVIWTGSIAIV